MTARAQGMVDWQTMEMWENPYPVGTVDHYNWRYAWMEMEMKSIKEVLDESNGSPLVENR